MKGFWTGIFLLLLTLLGCQPSDSPEAYPQKVTPSSIKDTYTVKWDTFPNVGAFRDFFCESYPLDSIPMVHITSEQTELLPDSIPKISLHPHFQCWHTTICIKERSILRIEMKSGKFLLENDTVSSFEMVHILAAFYFYTPVLRGPYLANDNDVILGIHK